MPKKPWSGLLNGKLERQMGCPQVNVLLPNAAFEGEEDCLYLNIYRPSVSFDRFFSSLKSINKLV